MFRILFALIIFSATTVNAQRINTDLIIGAWLEADQNEYLQFEEDGTFFRHFREWSVVNGGYWKIESDTLFLSEEDNFAKPERYALIDLKKNKLVLIDHIDKTRTYGRTEEE